MVRPPQGRARRGHRSEEHTSELQSPCNLVCRLLLEEKTLDAHHRPATVRTDTKRSGFFEGRCCWLALRLHRCEGLPAEWQESGPSLFFFKAEGANGDQPFSQPGPHPA